MVLNLLAFGRVGFAIFIARLIRFNNAAHQAGFLRGLMQLGELRVDSSLDTFFDREDLIHFFSKRRACTAKYMPNCGENRAGRCDFACGLVTMLK